MRQPRRILLAWLLLSLPGAPSVLALDPERAITQYARASFHAPLVLPHDDVSALTESRDGYLWIGTVEGLARFDGVRSVVFDKSNTPALANNWIKAVLEDRLGRIWIATFGGGVVCRENGRFVRYGEQQGLPNELVYSLTEDREGRIWAGTAGNGFVRFSDGRFVREPGTEAAAGSAVRALLQARDGTLWIGADDGLYRFRDGRTTRLTRADGLTDDRIMALAEGPDALWIGTEKGGVNRLANGRFTAITVREGLSHERVWSLAVDRDGNVWIGTDGGGLDRWSRGRLSSFSTRNGLDNDYVWALHEDRAGSLWVGTNGAGLARLQDGRVVPLTTAEGLPSDFAWSVCRTRDGSLWVGSEDAGLARVRDGAVTRFTTRDGLSSNQVKALVESPDGSLWIGGNEGIDRFRDGRITRAAVPELAGLRINALALDREGSLWIASDRGGLRVVRNGRLSVVPGTGKRAGEQLNSVRVARDGAVWFGSLGGLGRLRGEQLQWYGRAEGLPSARVSSIFEDPAGQIWAATQGGLVRVQGERAQSVGSKEGLHDDSIAVAIGDDSGGIWMGTNRGISRVARRDVEDVMAGRRTSLPSLVLGLEDGLPNVEINGSGSSAWKDPGGRLWFATRGGVASVDPARLATEEHAPSVLIEEVRADDRVLPGSGGWRLPPETRRLTFQFTSLGSRFPARTRFFRRLEGFDGAFVDGGSARTADYTNLPYGRYRFRVVAAGEDGRRHEPGASVEFRIEPRLQDTLWFRALALAAFAVALPLVYTVRLRRLRRQKLELERLVAERTAEVQAANARLAQLSSEDALTGLANRRRLDEALEEEWRRAVRQRTALGFLLVDVDLFKDYNDRLGHPAGDACLRVVAQAMSEMHRRAGELVARYGGEEFVVLIPGVSRDAVFAAAEALRLRVVALALPHPASTVAAVVTVSVGVAWTEPQPGTSAAGLVSAADRALYSAKDAGRNRVGR
jgi:diguanylate cyclase (GGDEF)-like protein